jgi:hypothetical protein
MGDTLPARQDEADATGTARTAGGARSLILPLLALYLLALAVNLSSVQAVSGSQVLMGEEMAVSIRDYLFWTQHAEASVWSTNTPAPLFYGLASHLDPAYDLFTGRRWKAGALALLPPLVFLTLRRRLGCGAVTAAGGALTVALLPGVQMFGWLATENGLETVVGILALLLATSPGRWWRVAPVPAAIATMTYPSGLAWAVAVVAVCAVRAIRSPHRLRDLLLVALALVVGGALYLSPRLWWIAGPQRIGGGGGTLDTDMAGNLATLVHQLAVSARGYYFFGGQPALGSAWLAGAMLVAAGVALAVRPARLWPWVLVAAMTVVMWLLLGNLPGVRRAIAIPVVGAMVLAVLVDVVWRRWPRPVTSLVLGAAAALVVLPLAAQVATWQQSFRGGSQALVADFPIAPGPMPPTFARYHDDLTAGRETAASMVADHDGIRTLAVVWTLADRPTGDTAGLPTPEEIVRASLPAEQLPPG